MATALGSGPPCETLLQKSVMATVKTGDFRVGGWGAVPRERLIRGQPGCVPRDRTGEVTQEKNCLEVDESLVGPTTLSSDPHFTALHCPPC